MKKLSKTLDKIITDSKLQHIELETGERGSISYPFSYYAQLVIYLVSKGILSYDEYKTMLNDFTMRNPYLFAFEMAPRTFGETWLEKRLLNIFPVVKKKGLEKATKVKVTGGKKTLPAFPDYKDPLGKPFTSQFDFICHNGINRYKVEVKACRAIAGSDNNHHDSNVASRAYTYKSAKDNKYQFHFQQIKPGFCDIFIFVGVCTDKILYWILTAEEVRNAGGLSPQHPTSGIKDIYDAKFEGQVYKTMDDYKPYLVDEKKILKTIIKKLK